MENIKQKLSVKSSKKIATMEANFHYTCLYEENANQKLGLESVEGKLGDI